MKREIEEKKIPSYKEFVFESVESKRLIQVAFKKATSLTDAETIKTELIDGGANKEDVEYYFKVIQSALSIEDDNELSGASNSQINQEEDDRIKPKDNSGAAAASPDAQKDKATW